MSFRHSLLPFFFFNDTATTEIYTLSLHDALPICRLKSSRMNASLIRGTGIVKGTLAAGRSEEHTSELQSRLHLVCRLLLEKKKTQTVNVNEIPLLDIRCGSTSYGARVCV